MIICLIILSVLAILPQNLPSVDRTETDATNQAANKWTADDMVMSEQASSVQISPDCGWIVWIKSVPNKEKDKNTSNLILASLKEKKEIQLTPGTDGVSDPKWSPDGIDINEAQTNQVGAPKGGAGSDALNGFSNSPSAGTVLRLNGEAIEEFRVTTTNPNASQGRSSGAQISLITKSGSNSFRGALFEFNRDTAFTANNFF